MKYPIALLLTALLGSSVFAEDWPTILGPRLNGVSTETGIITPWPRNGLRKLWECELGIGYAPPAIAKGRLYHFDRFGDQARLTCRDARTGRVIWQFEYPTDYEDRYGYEAGPRACPLVDDDRVYLHGVEGMLYCLRADDGQELWKVDTRAKYRFHQNFFGVASVPVVHGELLIVPVGGSDRGPRPADFRDVKPNGTAIVAFDKKTGAVKYEMGNELASYSNPLIATINGKATGLYFARGGLLAFEPQTGKELFHYPFRARDLESVNAATPVVIGNQVLLTECYGPGGVLLDLKEGKPRVIWTDADRDRFEKALQCHWNTPIHVDGYVYGSSGRHESDAELRCVELASGEVKWAKRRTTRCTLLLVDGHLISLSENGDLTLIKVNPNKYEEISRYEVPELLTPCWAPPALSNGILYLRGKGKLVALELIPAKK
jgi:outer membrane protein assembly factor BamB